MRCFFLFVGLGFGTALGQTATKPGVPNPVSSAAAASPDLQWLRDYLAGDSYYLDAANRDHEKAAADLNRVKTLLQLPAVIQSLGPAPLLNHVLREYDLRVNTHNSDLRILLVQTLNREWPRNPDVTGLFARELQQGNLGAAIDLAVFAPDIWTDDYVEPLVQVVEEKVGPGYGVMISPELELLDLHFPAWANRAATIGPRLRKAFEQPGGTGLDAATFTILSPPSRNDEHGGNERWFMHVAWLALAHDPASVAPLRPYLSNPTIVSEASGIPLRASDFAHDAILHILNEPGEFGLLTFDPHNPSTIGIHSGTYLGAEMTFFRQSWVKDKIRLPVGATYETQWAQWDAANAALAKRLDAMPVVTASPTSSGPENAPVAKEGLSVVVEPVKKVVSLSEPLVMKVTYRNVSKQPFRLPDQVVFHMSDGTQIELWGLFWRLTLYEEATGKTFTDIEEDLSMNPNAPTVKASKTIQPGESLVETVELRRNYFRSDFGGVRVGGDGPGLGASGVGYIPTGAYKLTVNIRFPVKPAPDGDPTPLWQGDSIQANPVEITIAPEGAEFRK